MTVRRFDSVLVANRGEIAVRLIRACQSAGLRAVAVYSDSDRSALHVRLADEAHRLGPSPAAESYLNAAAILDAARRSGAQALHPGYGFLAENAAFAEQCQRAGLVWIGPPPAAMRLLGDKAAAKALAERVGVPGLPGFHSPSQDDASLRAAADQVGYPLLVKAVAGGGGRGLRLVRDSDGLAEALASARREAQAAFGSGDVLLERYLERPRHVEMQIFGDEHGRIVYLGERDCSIQRRNQKVIEEAPAPDFSPAQRETMGAAAVALAAAAGYTNAGTVEFLLDPDGQFYFLEMNTRLQVEHPVTEFVTGLDLVSLQLRVAAGEPLPFGQGDLRISGHAIEARLYAEDPASGFLPSSGRLIRFQLPPAGPGVRIDRGVVAGDIVSSYYDPLLAKIIVHAADRAQARSALTRALAETDVQGVRTNLEFLEAVVASPAFADGQVHTGFIDQQGLQRGPQPPPPDVLIAAAASEVLLDRQRGSEAGDPWVAAGPWRTGWVGAEVRYRHASGLLRVGFRPPLISGEPWRFELPDGSVQRRSVQVHGPEVLLDGPGGRRRISVYRDQQRREVGEQRPFARLELVSGLDPASGRGAAEGGADHDVVRAPMPGRVLQGAVAVGDRVKANQTLVVLEAMKIEHLVVAPRDGVVEAVRYKEGDRVELGATLVELEER